MGQYSISNPKIDLFCNGRYIGSTNKFKTAKAALYTYLLESYSIKMTKPYHRYADDKGNQFIAVIAKR